MLQRDDDSITLASVETIDTFDDDDLLGIEEFRTNETDASSCDGDVSISTMGTQTEPLIDTAPFRPPRSISRPPRSISFHDEPTIQEIPYADQDLSKEEFQAAWYSQAELQATITECRITVAAMLQGKVIKDDDEEYTQRGLEFMTAEGFDISQNIKEIVQSVLEEQTRQKEEKTHVPDFLAAILAGASAHRSRIAQLIGMRDARAVHGALVYNTSDDDNCEPSERQSNPWRKRTSDPLRGALGINTSFSRRRERQSRCSSLQTSSYSFNDNNANAGVEHRRPPLRNRSSGRLRRYVRRSPSDISATPTPELESN
jgi:hypothetical protein